VPRPAHTPPGLRECGRSVPGGMSVSQDHSWRGLAQQRWTAGRGRTHVRVGPVAFGMPVRAHDARRMVPLRGLGAWLDVEDAWKEGVPESEGTPSSPRRVPAAELIMHATFCAALTDLPAASIVGWCRLRFACDCAVAAARSWPQRCLVGLRASSRDQSPRCLRSRP
jgi:hypothetical protein